MSGHDTRISSLIARIVGLLPAPWHFQVRPLMGLQFSYKSDPRWYKNPNQVTVLRHILHNANSTNKLLVTVYINKKHKELTNWAFSNSNRNLDAQSQTHQHPVDTTLHRRQSNSYSSKDPHWGKETATPRSKARKNGRENLVRTIAIEANRTPREKEKHTRANQPTPQRGATEGQETATTRSKLTRMAEKELARTKAIETYRTPREKGEIGLSERSSYEREVLWLFLCPSRQRQIVFLMERLNQ